MDGGDNLELPTLGRGTHSLVRGDGKIARKYLTCMDAAIREVWATSLLDHPSIIKFDSIEWAISSTDAAADAPAAVLTMPQMTPLREWIAAKPAPADIIRFIHDMGQALQHLQRRQVIHCDIKPANILMDADGRAVICDFSASAPLIYSHNSRYEAFYAFSYRPPEMNSATKQLSVYSLSDVWAFGCTVADIFGIPFIGVSSTPENLLDSTEYICRAMGVKPRTTTSARISQLRSLSAATIEQAVRRRYEIVVEDKFRSDPEMGIAVMRLLVRCLTCDPKRRFTPSNIINLLAIIPGIDKIIPGYRSVPDFAPTTDIWWRPQKVSISPLTKYWVGKHTEKTALAAVINRAYELVMANCDDLPCAHDVIFIACCKIVHIAAGLPWKCRNNIAAAVDKMVPAIVGRIDIAAIIDGE
ncbi:MAG: protein kinase family protein [Castellaniella sp.]